MKVLYVFDVKGHLGDAIRINGILEKLRAVAQVETLNFKDYYGDGKVWSNYTYAPSLLAAAAFNPQVFKHAAYSKLCAKIIETKIKASKPDFVWCEGIVQAGAIADTCKKLGVKLVTDVHGLASAEYIENKFIPHSQARYDYLLKLEKNAAQKSEYITTVAKPMNDYFEKLGVDKKKLVALPNGATLHTKLATYEEPMKAIYGGIFAFWEDIDSFIDAAKIDHNHKYILAGAGPLKDHVENRVKTENVPLEYLGRVPKEKIMDTFASAQIGIAPSVDAVTRRVACPIKVFDYLACGLPVITPDFGEWATVIKQNKCGIVTSESTGVAFRDAMNEIDEDAWSKMSKNAVSLIKSKWNWDVLLEPVKNIVKD